jgi:sulfur carrier protein ThiS
VSADSCTIEFTGPLEVALGRRSMDVACPAPVTIGGLLARLVAEHPEAGRFLGDGTRLAEATGPLPTAVLVIRDGAALPASLAVEVRPGERLTLLTMISGG